MRVCQFHHPSKAEKRGVIYHIGRWRARGFFGKIPPMFEVRNVCFSRGGRDILSGVSFSVDAGDVLAITGVNGAGKSTLLKILAGIWLPTSGAVLAEGADVFAEPIRHRRRLGWLGESLSAETDISVRSYLKYRARLKGEQSRKIRHRVREAMSICGLEQFSDFAVGSLSRGQRKRVALAEAVLLRPRLLLLDDVFADLDMDARESVVSLLDSFRAFASVILAGHEADWFGRAGATVLELKSGRIA